MNYLRPRSLFEKFLVREKVTSQNEIGRVIVEFKDTDEIIFGLISRADYKEVEKYKSTHHEATHVVVSRGNVKAKIGDMLVKVDRKFLVTAVETIADWVNYFIVERKDL